jgi:hypothetical protein
MTEPHREADTSDAASSGSEDGEGDYGVCQSRGERAGYWSEDPSCRKPSKQVQPSQPFLGPDPPWRRGMKDLSRRATGGKSALKKARVLSAVTALQAFVAGDGSGTVASSDAGSCPVPEAVAAESSDAWIWMLCFVLLIGAIVFAAGWWLGRRSSQSLTKPTIVTWEASARTVQTRSQTQYGWHNQRPRFNAAPAGRDGAWVWSYGISRVSPAPTMQAFQPGLTPDAMPNAASPSRPIEHGMTASAAENEDDPNFWGPPVSPIAADAPLAKPCRCRSRWQVCAGGPDGPCPVLAGGLANARLFTGAEPEGADASMTEPHRSTDPSYAASSGSEDGEGDYGLCESCGRNAVCQWTQPECLSCYQEH